MSQPYRGSDPWGKVLRGRERGMRGFRGRGDHIGDRFHRGDHDRRSEGHRINGSEHSIPVMSSLRMSNQRGFTDDSRRHPAFTSVPRLSEPNELHHHNIQMLANTTAAFNAVLNGGERPGARHLPPHLEGDRRFVTMGQLDDMEALRHMRSEENSFLRGRDISEMDLYGRGEGVGEDLIWSGRYNTEDALFMSRAPDLMGIKHSMLGVRRPVFGGRRPMLGIRRANVMQRLGSKRGIDDSMEGGDAMESPSKIYRTVAGLRRAHGGRPGFVRARGNQHSAPSSERFVQKSGSTCHVCNTVISFTVAGHNVSRIHKLRLKSLSRGCHKCNTGKFETYRDMIDHFNSVDHHQKKQSEGKGSASATPQKGSKVPDSADKNSKDQVTSTQTIHNFKPIESKTTAGPSKKVISSTPTAQAKNTEKTLTGTPQSSDKVVSSPSSCKILTIPGKRVAVKRKSTGNISVLENKSNMAGSGVKAVTSKSNVASPAVNKSPVVAKSPVGTKAATSTKPGTMTTTAVTSKASAGGISPVVKGNVVKGPANGAGTPVAASASRLISKPAQNSPQKVGAVQNNQSMVKQENTNNQPQLERINQQSKTGEQNKIVTANVVSSPPDPEPLSDDLVFNPDTVVGQHYVMKVTGYFCKLCNKFYNNEEHAKIIHCMSEPHFLKYKAALQAKELQSAATASKSESTCKTVKL